jgi:tetratricopeptide (TPR) repeat protein
LTLNWFITTFAKILKLDKMKKILALLAIGVIVSTAVFSQTQKRTSAYMYNKNGQLDKAMVEINEAILNEKTSADPKTWMYRGEIYYNISTSPLPAYQALDTNAALVSYQSFMKAKEYDAKGVYTEEINPYLGNLTNEFYRIGGTSFQAGNYNKAIANFETAFNIAEGIGKFDTIAAFNIGMCGVLSEQPKVAAKYLQKCVDVNFKDPRIYMFYNRAAKQMGDTTLAFSIVQQGRERFPDDVSILLEEAQLYLETGQNEKLLNSLLIAVKSDPTNANLFFLIGKCYDDKKDIKLAEQNYMKAAELNPDFFEAYYNLGAIYVNIAAEYQAQANDLPLNETAKYDQLTNLANEQLALAVPYLENALQVRPDDQQTKAALREAYARLKMTEKLQKLNQQ